MRPSAVGHFVILALVASCAEAFIVPEELVSFLSIVYSNIPPIRKGTDSRVGVGFRLGPHADAQIVLELGPQTNTRPLGAAAPSFSAPSSSKRHTAPALPLDDAPLDDVAPAALNPAAGSWLTSWRTSVAARNRPAANLVDNDLVSQEEVSGPGAVTLPDPTKLSGAPLVSHLRQLYRKEAVRPTERQPKRQPERQAERQPELQPETLPSWDSKRTVERPVASKGSKRPKSAGKTVGKVPASAKQFTTQDLSDVSLD